MTHLRGVKPPLIPDRAPLTKAPTAPKWMTDEAKAEWKRIMPRLIEDRIITKADLAGVEAYCSAAGAARQITEHMRGLPIPDLKLGGLQIRYMMAATRLAAEYGLTPTSRARVGSAANDDDDNDNPMLIGRNRTHA